ncbi:unnamed protein product [Closterium sp. NIES-65]|nr:unnamed protein product [Closterium sp. NIES-65]
MPAAESSNPVIVLLPDGSIRLYHEALLQVADVLRGFPCHSLASLNQPLQENSAADPIAGATCSTAAADSHSPKPASINVIPPPVAAAAATASSSGGSPVAGTSAGLLFPAASAPKPPREPAVPAPLPRDQFLQPGGTYALFRPAALARAASAAFAESSSSSLRFEWITDSRSDHSRAASGAMGRREAPIQDPRLIRATRHHEPPADVTRSARADSEWEPDDDVMRAMIPPAAAVSCFMPVSSRKPASTTEDPQRVADDEAQGAGAASNHPWFAAAAAATRLFRASSMPSGGAGSVSASLTATSPVLVACEATSTDSPTEHAAAANTTSTDITNRCSDATTVSAVNSSAAESFPETNTAASLRRTRSSVGRIADAAPTAGSAVAPPAYLPAQASAAPLISPRGLLSASSRKLVRALTALPRPRLSRNSDVRAAADRRLSTFLAAYDGRTGGNGCGGGGDGGGDAASRGGCCDGGSSSFSEGAGPWSLIDFLSPREKSAEGKVKRGFELPAFRGDSSGAKGAVDGATTTVGSSGKGKGRGARESNEVAASALAAAAFTSDWASQMAEFIGASSASSASAASVARPLGAAVMGEHGEKLDAVGPRTTGSRSSGTGWTFSAGERSGDKANAGARVGGAGGWQAGSFSTGSSGGGIFGVGITGRDGVAAAWEALGSSRSGVRGAREERDGFLRYAGERGGAGSGESERAGEDLDYHHKPYISWAWLLMGDGLVLSQSALRALHAETTVTTTGRGHPSVNHDTKRIAHGGVQSTSSCATSESDLLFFLYYKP